MHSRNAVSRILSSCSLPGPDGISRQMQMLNLPALLHVIPGAVLHDALLMVGWNVRRNEQILQLDLTR